MAQVSSNGNASVGQTAGENGSVEVTGRTSSGTPLMALPPPPQGFAGSSEVKKDNYKVHVSNKEGYLSTIVVDALFDTTPESIFELFTHSDNTAAFRDIKSIAGRKVVEMDGKRTVVEVEQIGEMRVLWMKKYFSTFLRVVEDATDPKHLVVVFELLKSDVLDRFHGRWDLEPVLDEKTGKTKCQSKLTQDVSPKGVPPFLAHLPILGGMLRGIGVRTARRIIEDVNGVVSKMKNGKTIDEVLASLKPAGDPKAKDVNVSSFAINEDDEEEDSNADVVDTPAPLDDAAAATPSIPAIPAEAAAALAPLVANGVATPAKTDGDIGATPAKTDADVVATPAKSDTDVVTTPAKMNADVVTTPAKPDDDLVAAPVNVVEDSVESVTKGIEDTKLTTME